MKVILHVGMPKCGSSAIQTYLSSHQFAETFAGRLAYAAIYNTGEVLSGEELIRRAGAAPFSYCTSHSGASITGLSDKLRKNVLASLKEIGKEVDTLILSHEGWGPNPQHFPDDFLLSDEEFEVTVLAYVRPQLEWMNSAWWQWGAWTDLPVSKWINRNRPKAQWHSLLRMWAEKPWVRQVDTRLLDGDIVQNFMAYLGYAILPQPRTNQSLPDIVLRLFQRNRQLRPGPHDSAIEFALARHLQLGGEKTPWVLRPNLVKQLIEFFREDNEQLANSLPADQRQKMLDDPRWWQAEHFLQRRVSKPVVARLNTEELEQLAVSALETIRHLDAELRLLK